MKYISTDKAPSAVGPYSQAIQLDNGFLYVSGQLGFVPETMKLAGDVEAETLQSLKNVEEILKTVDYTKNDVVKTTVLLANIEDFPKVNQIYETFFGQHKPARSAFAVKNLPKGGLVEIEVIAVK